MGWKAQISWMVFLLMGLVLFWSELPRRWRAGLASAWALVLACVLGHRFLRTPLDATHLGQETRLQDDIREPGVAGRRLGPLRAYLAVPHEVRLENTASDAVTSPVFGPGSAFPVAWDVVKPATREWTVRAARVPILVVLENDTYLPVGISQLGWKGPNLCTVRVERMEAEPCEEVYRMDVPLPSSAFLLSPAQRRNVTVHWPLEAVAAGEYRVSVQLPFGGQPVVETRTRLH